MIHSQLNDQSVCSSALYCTALHFTALALLVSTTTSAFTHPNLPTSRLQRSPLTCPWCFALQPLQGVGAFGWTIRWKNREERGRRSWRADGCLWTCSRSCSAPHVSGLTYIQHTQVKGGADIKDSVICYVLGVMHCQRGREKERKNLVHFALVL